MAVIRLDAFREDTVVVHFGGAAGSIDAYTLGNALIGFADTAYAVNATLDPGHDIEIVIEATGPGSYRTIVRRVRKHYKGVLSGIAATIFWNVVSNAIFDAALKSADPKPQIVINTNEIVIRHGNDTIIVPRNIYDATENAKKNPAVQKGIKKTFDALAHDINVTEFGITSGIADRQPLIRIPRTEFPVDAMIVSEAVVQPNVREVRQRARLLILKAWLNHAKRKWSFEWNGVPISAPISDIEFLDQLDRREHLLGAGDALDVEITYRQVLDPDLGVYINDQNSFVVTRVIRPVPRSRPLSLITSQKGRHRQATKRRAKKRAKSKVSK